MSNKKNKKRILTGDTPTGKLHLGHYVGTLENRIKFQDDYESFIISADLHAFAYPKYVSNPKYVAQCVIDVAIGNLAVGLDPNKATMFVESGIPEIYELASIFAMLVSHNRTLRNPTIKDEIKMKEMGDNYSLGFIYFPIMQVADIVGIKGELVPAGVDQAPHVEQTIEIAKKFNRVYGETFPIPELLLGRVGKLVGIDGNPKMGKSLNNAIYLGETETSLKEKIMHMYTDPTRIHATDPGTVEGNPAFDYHDAFNSNKDEVEDLKTRYRNGKVGDIEVKECLFLALNDFLKPIREKHNYYERHTAEVKEILSEGTKKTRKVVQTTLEEVKDKLFLTP